MHIVFFEYASNYGGAIRCTVEEAIRLKDHAKVSVIDPYGCCKPFGEALATAGIDHHVLDPRDEARVVGGHGNPITRGLRILASLPHEHAIRGKVAKVVKKIGGTVLCSSSTKGVCTIATIRALKHIPTVAYLHGWYTPNMIRSYARPIYRRDVAAMIAVARATKSATICSGVPADRVHVILNPIDLDAMAARAEGPLEAPLPDADKPVRILLPGMYSKRKQLHVAVEALAKVIADGFDAVLYFAGRVPFGEDPTYLPRTKQMAEELGVTDRVHWLGMRGDIPQVMKASDIIVLPAYSEGMPRTIQEAMAMKRPVVTTPVGGNVELIFDGHTGRIFDVGESDALARCITEMAADPDGTQAMVERAYEIITRKEFRPDYQTRKLVELFAKVEAGA